MKKNAKVEVHYEKPVWVNPTTESIRRDECLCLNCTKLRPGTVNNCSIAQKLYDVCLFDATALIVTRCPEYQPKTLAKESPAIEGAKDYLSMKGESGGPIRVPWWEQAGRGRIGEEDRNPGRSSPGIKRNVAKCKKCETTVESTYRHDFKWCSCKSIAVDGGRDYIRRAGDLESVEELSEYN